MRENRNYREQTCRFHNYQEAHPVRTEGEISTCAGKDVLQNRKERVSNPVNTRGCHLLQDQDGTSVLRQTGGSNRWGNHIWLGCSWWERIRRQQMHVCERDWRVWKTLLAQHFGSRRQRGRPSVQEAALAKWRLRVIITKIASKMVLPWSL